MAEIQQHPSTLPPKKVRDPNLAERNKDELKQTQHEYIAGIAKSAAHESLRQGTMHPTSLRIGKDGKSRLCELEKRLLIEENILLNMALAYAYTEAKQRKLSAEELRLRIESMQLDEEYVSLKIHEPVLNILLECSIKDADAQFVYLNAGLDLLYSRLVSNDLPSVIWK
ncbi:hypothetical protein [Dolichospermum planctonicum]|uniref:Uncharacterized protein n=1 Tax=Dolichospermum planctonicum TaxID=136072 RepID=A0A480ADT9_9CYAN|nr:hypothetical protein [Dolichospermum planctonicum]GCL43325.1 hypothetical protein NIES80_30390 [Dolichospermum planctonicum]